MFRKMRRIKQVLPEEKCMEILEKATSGVLAVSGDGEYPYGVPLSYVFVDNKIYFHSAKEGHKIDAINNNEKVSFCVIEKDEIVPKEYTSYFRSVIVFGKARLLGDEEKKNALETLANKYSPGEDGVKEEVEKSLKNVAIIEMTIDHISGKEAIELVRE